MFLGLVLDIKDMSEENKLFYFLEGLKPWARTKLQRHRIQVLVIVQTAVEHLMDYATKNTQPKKAQHTALASITNGKNLERQDRVKVREQTISQLSPSPH